jgi:hypothetical protein
MVIGKKAAGFAGQNGPDLMRVAGKYREMSDHDSNRCDGKSVSPLADV